MLLCCTKLAYLVHSGVSQGVTCNLMPHCMGPCHGQILIETATYSCVLSIKLALLMLLIIRFFTAKTTASCGTSTTGSIDLMSAMLGYSEYSFYHVLGDSLQKLDYYLGSVMPCTC